MTAFSFNLVFTIYLGLICPRSHGLEVVQPQNRTVSPDGVASISCEFTAANKTIVDVRLNVISPADSKRTVLCLKGSDSCHIKKIYMMPEDPENDKKWLFFMNEIEPKDMDMMYECEFTASNAQGHHITWRGKPTALLPGPLSSYGQKEADCLAFSSQPDQMGWILIGLLALLLLCTGVIVYLYIRLRKSKVEYDHGTYVEMRKAPLLRNTPAGVYCVN